MKTIKNLGMATLMITLLSFSACGQINSTGEKNIAKTAGKGFAVLELFTSEGCSSCPPADELMAKIQQEAKGKAVYILAYHVDYWNRLGWKDVFSDADFSKRQKQYSGWLNAQIYTPQLVINGKEEFVGSDETAIRNAIVNELNIVPIAALVLHAQQGSDILKVHYTTNYAKGSHLLIAVIQKKAQTKVERGENAGHTLSHIQIVRKLQNEPLNITGEGNVVVALPKGFNTGNWEVLGLIQNESNGQILGIAKADINTYKDYESVC